jgi:hypothetical protein
MVVLVLILLLARKPQVRVPAVPGVAPPASAASTVRAQAQQIQQQFKQQLDAAMQTPRDVPDEAK